MKKLYVLFFLLVIGIAVPHGQIQIFERKPPIPRETRITRINEQPDWVIFRDAETWTEIACYFPDGSGGGPNYRVSCVTLNDK